MTKLRSYSADHIIGSRKRMASEEKEVRFLKQLLSKFSRLLSLSRLSRHSTPSRLEPRSSKIFQVFDTFKPPQIWNSKILKFPAVRSFELHLKRLRFSIRNKSFELFRNLLVVNPCYSPLNLSTTASKNFNTCIIKSSIVSLNNSTSGIPINGVLRDISMKRHTVYLCKIYYIEMMNFSLSISFRLSRNTFFKTP